MGSLPRLTTTGLVASYYYMKVLNSVEKTVTCETTINLQLKIRGNLCISVEFIFFLIKELLNVCIVEDFLVLHFGPTGTKSDSQISTVFK